MKICDTVSLSKFLLVALYAPVALSGCQKPLEMTPSVRSAVVAHPQLTAISPPEVYAGEIYARFESTLAFRVNGKIKKRHVDVGAQVTKGELLAELDAQDIQLQRDSAQAAVKSAEADMTLATSEQQRYRTMLTKGLISSSQFEAKDHALKVAKARVSQTHAALAVAENQTEYTMLRADTAGVITAIVAESGQIVAAGQMVMKLAQEGEREVEISIPEARISNYHKGTLATIELWNKSGLTLPGEIREISPQADQVTRTYQARVAINSTQHSLSLGQTARIYFSAKDTQDLLMIPLSALYERDGKSAVWIVDSVNKQVHLSPVTIDAYRETGITILSGLDPSQWIVVAGVHTLHETQLIRPVDSANHDVAL